MKLLVVVVSVRNGRAGIKVSDWFVNQVEKDGRFEINLIDLKKLDLPYDISEVLPSSIENSQYEDEKVRKWAKDVSDADAVAFICPEYNHGMPASLKNALDHLAAEWKDKPTGFIGYGAAGAPYSQAALALASTWLHLDIVTPRVGISEIWSAFNDKKELNFADYYEHQAKSVLNALAGKAANK